MEHPERFVRGGDCGLFFAELCEDAAGALRVQECNLQAVGTLAGSLVDEAETLCVAEGQRVGYTILHLEGDVVDATAAVVQELLYGALGSCGFQQFQLHLTHLHEGGLHFLVFYHFFLVDVQTQDILEIRTYCLDALHGNTKMFTA